MRRAAIVATAGVLFMALAAAVTAWVVDPERQARPPEDSVAVGFARDMIRHHAQGVEMAELIRGRTSDPELAALAADIALTQQAQIGRMQGWLALWGWPVASVGPRMAWMGQQVEGSMPGLASRDQLRSLVEADGVAAERRFLELMIDHRLAGAEMAAVAASEAEVAEVRRLADAIASGQRAEVEVMRRLLAERMSPESAT